MEKRILYLLLLCIGLAFFWIPSAIALRQIPDNNLSYPVLIRLQKSAGSGFFINKNNKIYLVTARHVLYSPTTVALKSLPKGIRTPDSIGINLRYDKKKGVLSFKGVMSIEDKKILLNISQDESYRIAIQEIFRKSQSLELKGTKAQLLSYPRDINENALNVIDLNLSKLNAKKKALYHLTKDIAIIGIGEGIAIGEGEEGYKLNFFDGVHLLKNSQTGIVTLKAENIKPFKDAMVGNDIFVFGFPSSIGLNSPEFSVQRPLIRKGILSGKNLKLKTLILDCPVHHGNSGSLVIEKEEKGLGNFNFSAIGIAVRYVPVFEKGIVEIATTKEFMTYSNSGYTVVEPIDFVFELLKE